MIPLAWLIAGSAGRAQGVLDGTPALARIPGWIVGYLGGLAVLNISVTGFATWYGAGMLAIPSLAVVNLLALIVLWQATGRQHAVQRADGTVRDVGDGV